MDAYKFNVKIGNDGSIQLPYLVNLVNREAEIFIIPKAEKTVTFTKERKGQNFVKMWTGFISESTKSQSRIEFIREKYK